MRKYSNKRSSNKYYTYNKFTPVQLDRDNDNMVKLHFERVVYDLLQNNWEEMSFSKNIFMNKIFLEKLIQKNEAKG